MKNFSISFIGEHEQELFARKIPQGLNSCPYCFETSENITLHALKDRYFYIIVKTMVRVIESILGRFKCSSCKRTFTFYPSYAVPYKRYVKIQLLDIAEDYLEEKGKRYQDAVSCDDSPIMYESEDPSSPDKYFEGSTVWRWLSYIASFEQILPQVKDLIRQKSSTSPIFRQVIDIPRKKYRSEKRKKQLLSATMVVLVAREFARYFNLSIFTDFARGIP